MSGPKKFISDSEMDSLGKNEGPGIGETAARSATQGLTYGLADEASGLLGALTEPLFMKSDKNFGGRYEEYRNAYRKGDKASAEANPKTALLAELAGGIAAPGGAASKGLGLGARAIRASGQGALNAYGKSEAETPEGLLPDIATGAALGAGGAALGGLLSKAVPTSQGTKALAIDQTIKHLRPTPKVAASLGPDKLEEVAKAALKGGAVGFASKAYPQNITIIPRVIVFP